MDKVVTIELITDRKFDTDKIAISPLYKFTNTKVIWKDKQHMQRSGHCLTITNVRIETGLHAAQQLHAHAEKQSLVVEKLAIILEDFS